MRGTSTAVTVRAATPADAPSILDLVNAVDLDDIGSADFSLGEMREDLARADDLAQDSWLAHAGDRLVAYGILWSAGRGGRIDVEHYALPDHLPAGRQVLDLMTARSAAVARAGGAEAAVVHLHLTPRSAFATELPARGWRAVRRHHVLTRPVSVAADPVPESPAGVTVRTAAGPADQEVVHRILDTSFAGHFDHEPQEYQAWRRRVGADRLDWSLVWVAAVGGEDVGACLAHSDRATMGWVRGLGVLEPARGRGIARHLLRVAFAEFARRGRHTVGLGVDTGNATGAVRLYEGLGMTVYFEADTWEVVVPAAGATPR